MEEKLKMSAREQKEKTLSHIIAVFQKNKYLMENVRNHNTVEDIYLRLSNEKKLTKTQRGYIKGKLTSYYRYDHVPKFHVPLITNKFICGF